MRNKIKILTVLCLLLVATTAHSAASYQKSDYGRVTTWNKMTDYFATVGKTETEKRKILHKRKYDRRQMRIKKARLKAEKERKKRQKKLRSSYIHQ